MNDRYVTVLIETLRLTANKKTVDIADIALHAKASTSFVARVLPRAPNIPKETVSLDSQQRLLLSLEIARAGRFKDAAKELSWQEFESFGAECLAEAGFRVDKNVRVKGEGRAWQIDLTGYRGDLVLTIDCKHWNTSSYESRLVPPAEHQRKATAHLLTGLAKTGNDLGKSMQGLAVILTLLDPPVRFLERAALVSVEQLPSFLNAVTPYDDSLPLISTSSPQVENPMS